MLRTASVAPPGPTVASHGLQRQPPDRRPRRRSGCRRSRAARGAGGRVRARGEPRAPRPPECQPPRLLPRHRRALRRRAVPPVRARRRLLPDGHAARRRAPRAVRGHRSRPRPDRLRRRDHGLRPRRSRTLRDLRRAGRARPRIPRRRQRPRGVRPRLPAGIEAAEERRPGAGGRPRTAPGIRRRPPRVARARGGADEAAGAGDGAAGREAPARVADARRRRGPSRVVLQDQEARLAHDRHRQRRRRALPDAHRRPVVRGRRRRHARAEGGAPAAHAALPARGARGHAHPRRPGEPRLRGVLVRRDPRPRSPAGPRHYWFHAWPDDYAELRIASLRRPQELAEITFDVGVQLGRGHARQKHSSDSRRLRAELETALAAVDLQGMARALADATEEAWRRFRGSDPAGR